MNEIISQVLEKSKELQDTIVEYRRAIHMNPEVAFQEHDTAELVAKELERLGINVKTHIGDPELIKRRLKRVGEEPEEPIVPTGVLGVLHGEQGEGKTVLLRADMDALPLQETKDPDHIPNQEGFRSENDGVMHACGHDAHVAMLLGAAEVLSEMTERFSGTIKFLFQPAEEKGGGAAVMLEAGVVDDVDAAFGIHVWSPLEKGMVQINDGPQMASADKFKLEVEGGGGHGSAPHETKDPLSTASDIMNAYYKMADREIDTFNPSVITITKLTAGTTWNVIPSKAIMEGTVRTFDKEVRTYIFSRLQEIGNGLAEIQDLHFSRVEPADLEKSWTPPTINSVKEARMARETVQSLFGDDKVFSGRPIMGAEDFAFYLEEMPGCFIFLGVNNPEKGTDSPHHHPSFDVDEAELYKGAAIHSALALKYLQEKK